MQTRLTTLYQLQLIDDQLDMLEELRGDLPITVNELQSQIDAIRAQVEEKTETKDEAVKKRNFNDSEIVRLSENLKKFKAQLYKVRNNKEYDALTKEIDHAEEMIKNLENENQDLQNLAEKMKFEIEEISPQLMKLKEELTEKETELKQIIKANEREEVKLKALRDEVAAKVRKADYNTYIRIRKALRGKAVATISRSACSGCQNIVPPQRQLEVKSNKRIYTCESCGRMLVSPDVAKEAEKTLNI